MPEKDAINCNLNSQAAGIGIEYVGVWRTPE
jgi:hypothetical protein